MSFVIRKTQVNSAVMMWNAAHYDVLITFAWKENQGSSELAEEEAALAEVLFQAHPVLLIIHQEVAQAHWLLPALTEEGLDIITMVSTMMAHTIKAIVIKTQQPL